LAGLAQLAAQVHPVHGVEVVGLGPVGREPGGVGIHVGEQQVGGAHQGDSPPGGANPALVGEGDPGDVPGLDVLPRRGRGFPGGPEQPRRGARVPESSEPGGGERQSAQVTASGWGQAHQVGGCEAERGGAGVNAGPKLTPCCCLGSRACRNTAAGGGGVSAGAGGGGVVGAGVPVLWA